MRKNRIFTITIILFCLIETLPATLLAQNALNKTGNPTAAPLAAFSVRKLSSAYTGNAMRVQRSSDSATQDIGFTASGDLDTAALKAFVQSGDGYVNIWYDQSGNGYNAAPILGGKGPTIMTNGVINRDNDQPSVYTSGNTGFLRYGPITQLSGGMQVTRMEVARSRSSSFTIIAGLGNFQLDLQLFPTQVMVQFEDNNIAAQGAVSSTSALMSINSVRNNGDSKVYVNTSLLGDTAVALNPFPSGVFGYIGVRFDYNLGNVGPGAFSETILFNSVLSDADRQSINYNQNWYYSLGFVLCSSTQAALSPNGKTTKALYACTQDGPWAYYYDPFDPLKLLFGIAKDPGGTGANPRFMADSIRLTATASPFVYYSATSGTEGIFAPGRYWNVYTGNTLTSPVNVRFFYNPADTVVARIAAQNFKTNSGASMMSNLQWFKTTAGPFHQDSLTAIPRAYVKGHPITLKPVYGTKDGVRYVQFDSVTSFSGGTGVYIVSNTLTTLPIIIGSFTGRRVNETTALSWTTESESNSEWFVIERSADGNEWNKIGLVAAAGNSSTALLYRFTDAELVHEQKGLYYRLKLVDKDGKYSYSRVVFVKMYENMIVAPQLNRIVPNPFKSDVVITYTVPVSGYVQVLLQNMTGATLIRRKYTAKKGNNVVRLTDLEQLSRGTYIVRIVQGGAVGIGKVVKQ